MPVADTLRPIPSATLEDIGRELGLSAMTISRALNGHPAVREETRQRVLTRAAALNYRPNRWARSLATRRSQMAGIVVPDISHSFFAEVTHGVQAVLEARGYGLMLCHSHADPERERREMDMLLGSRVDGLIVASEQPEGSPEDFLALERERVPLVLVDRYFPGLASPCVTADDVAVGLLATRHLLDLGHRAIAHIDGPPVSTSRLRRDGYRAALRERGVAARPEWVVSGCFTWEGGHAAMRRLLSLPERPTAVFASNDPTAFGAIRACREAGLRVPEDLSIVGAGSIEGTYHPDPFLTTIDWPQGDLGRRAATLLLGLMDGDPLPAEPCHTFAPELCVRRSTAALVT